MIAGREQCVRLVLSEKTFSASPSTCRYTVERHRDGLQQGSYLTLGLCSPRYTPEQWLIHHCFRTVVRIVRGVVIDTVSIEVLQWARANGCEWNMYICSQAPGSTGRSPSSAAVGSGQRLRVECEHLAQSGYRHGWTFVA